jgi:hypothetical protein
MAEVKGTITKILDKVEGQGANGAWFKQEFVVQQEGQYGKPVAITAWNDKIDDIEGVGSEVTVEVNLESREHNGRWYTEAKMWKIKTTKSVPVGTSGPATGKDTDNELPW